jgi:hypothetical protein
VCIFAVYQKAPCGAFVKLSLNEGQKGHEPGALYGIRKHALVLGTNAGVFRIYYLGLSGSKTPEHLDVLVVSFLQVLGTKEALFLHGN